MAKTQTAKTLGSVINPSEDMRAQDMASIYLRAFDQSKEQGQAPGFVESSGAQTALGSGNVYPYAPHMFDPAAAQASINPATTVGSSLMTGPPTLGDAGGDLNLLAAYQQVRAEQQAKRDVQHVPGAPPVTPGSLPLLMQIIESLFGGGGAAETPGA